jgi:hypothetical protein
MHAFAFFCEQCQHPSLTDFVINIGHKTDLFKPRRLNGTVCETSVWENSRKISVRRRDGTFIQCLYAFCIGNICIVNKSRSLGVLCERLWSPCVKRRLYNWACQNKSVFRKMSFNRNTYRSLPVLLERLQVLHANRSDLCKRGIEL